MAAGTFPGLYMPPCLQYAESSPRPRIQGCKSDALTRLVVDIMLENPSKSFITLMTPKSEPTFFGLLICTLKQFKGGDNGGEDLV